MGLSKKRSGKINKEECLEYMQEDINKNQQLETAGESSVSTHYAYFSLRLFLILVMHIFLSMHLCMRGEKMANMMSA